MGPSGMVEQQAWTAEHAQAVVEGYALLEQSQAGPLTPRACALLQRAEEHGWDDVAVLVHYARFANAVLLGEPTDGHLSAMDRHAERSGDDSLRALLLATLDEQPGRDADLEGDEPDVRLAQAVAILDDGNGSAVHRPVAYIACGLGYGQRDLWELEEEMYARVEAALEIPLPPPLDATVEFNRRVVANNRPESHAAWTCALVEVGLLDEARRHAAARPRLSDAARAGLPAQWVRENDAVQYLLAAVAGEPEPEPLGSLRADLEDSSWFGHIACALVGGAVRALDAGDRARAADLAEQALKGLVDGYLPSVRMLALHLAATASATPASARYAEELVALRWNARLRMLGAARTRLAAERIRIDNERLSERAYLDELTGAGNRHAYALHVGRLHRGREGHGVAVLMLDVDHFKSVNDRFGHGVGDDVLRRVAALLAEHSRAGDLVSRMGGDEFVLVLDAVRDDEARRRADELVAAVRTTPWDDLHLGLTVTVSAGLAVGPSRDVDALLGLADERLYRAKADGRARLVAGC